MSLKSAVTKWLSDLPNSGLHEQYEARWATLTRYSNTVVTFFGSYDAGKSSLLRRLLIDDGVPAPDWLTISARHETFENNEVVLPDYVLRDSPGIAVGATDARGQNNTSQAMSAINATDVGIAVLTPQLITSDKEVFREVVAKQWPIGSLWFVISRFDEAGVDAKESADAYRDLAGKKIAELRELLTLDPDVPIFVVAQDPFQEAGPDNDVTKSLWDDFRSWDGIDTLQARLNAIPAPVPAEWRSAAEERFWGQALAETLAGLRNDLADCRSNSKVAAQGVARRDAWESELVALDNAALASLDGLVESVVDQWSASLLPIGQLQLDIKETLTGWFEEHDVQLRRLQSTIQKTSKRDRSRPNWNGFESLVSQFGNAGGQQQPPSAEDGHGVAEHVAAIGGHVVEILRVLADENLLGDNNVGLKNRGGRGARTGGGPNAASQYLNVAQAVLPLAIYVAKAIDDQKTPSAVGTNPPVPGVRQAVIDGCTAEARDTWGSFTEGTRAMIAEETDDQVALDATLRRSVEVLEGAIAAGEALLSASQSSAP